MAERPYVLYVDDEIEITDLMAVVLGSEGFDVTVANGGQAAIEALAGNAKINAIVLDYMMPKWHAETTHIVFYAALRRPSTLGIATGLGSTITRSDLRVEAFNPQLGRAPAAPAAA